jgi:hypothetical protein
MAYKKNYVSANGLSPTTNREIGRFLYGATFLSILVYSLGHWGTSVMDDIFIAIISVASYKLVGFFLRFIGFWPK